MSELLSPWASRDRGWLELRVRLARAAREMHFSALSSDAVNSAALLAMAENLANLAISIPMNPAASGIPSRPVDASTLVATQILQFSGPTRLRNSDRKAGD
jgi:hypothetical protein